MSRGRILQFESFDTFDDMMERLQEQMKAADAGVKPWQAAITTGDYFRRWCEYGFNIYGEVLKEDEPRDDLLTASPTISRSMRPD